jgi:hypothetical protein
MVRLVCQELAFGLRFFAGWDHLCIQEAFLIFDLFFHMLKFFLLQLHLVITNLVKFILLIKLSQRVALGSQFVDQRFLVLHNPVQVDVLA